VQIKKHQNVSHVIDVLAFTVKHAFLIKQNKIITQNI